MRRARPPRPPSIALPTLLALLASVASLACGCSDDDGGEQGSSTETGETETEAEGQAASGQGEGAGAESDDGGTDAGEPEPPGEKLRVLIKESRLLGNVPSEHETPDLHTKLEDDEIAVLVEHLDYDCGPVPGFEAWLVDGVVEVRMHPPEEDTGCIGPHDVKLRIDRPGEPPKRLRIVDSEGGQIVAGEVTAD